MITKAFPNEKDIIKQYWKHSFPEAKGSSIDAFFEVYYHEDDIFVLRNKDKEILALAHVMPKVIKLKDKHLKTLYVSHVMTRREFQGQGYMKELMQRINDLAKKEHILTVLRPYEPSVFRSLGYENVIANAEYSIATKNIPQLNIDGIILTPKPKDLLSVYEAFTHYFDGYFKRDESYFEKMLRYVRHQKGSIIGLKENDVLVGYCIYIPYSNHVEVIECAYDTSGTLVKLLSFISRGKHRVHLTASTSEKIQKLFPQATKSTQPFLMAKINDQQLFERLYGLKIISAYSAFNVSAKPLFNRDYQ